MDPRYAPTDPIPFDRQTPLVPSCHDEIPSRIDRFSRDDCALLIDFYLRRLVSLKNRVDPGLAAGLAKIRDGEKHQLLGFVKMKDYTEECIDLDWRRARYLMTIHNAFQGLPLLAEAFESGRLSWTRAREITNVAEVETEQCWLDFACSTTVRLLAKAVQKFRSSGRFPWESDEGQDEECSKRIDDQMEGHCDERPGDPAEGPWQTLSCRVPPALRQRWEAAVQACRRQTSAETPLWECAEYMAAEALEAMAGTEGGNAGPVPKASSGVDDHRPGSALRIGESDPTAGCGEGGLSSPLPEYDPEAGDLIKADIEEGYNNWDFLSWAPVVVKLVGQFEADLALVKSATSEASGKDGVRLLHEALVRLLGYHELIERYLGRLLRFFGDHRFHKLCRFLSLRHYAKERLGVSARQVGYLTSRERSFIHHPELEAAYLAGRIGSARVRLLEPLARQTWPCPWPAWIERAENVTVRRLADETRWALDLYQRDAAAWRQRKGMPPGPDEGPYALVDSARHICSGSGEGGEDTEDVVDRLDAGNENDAACPAVGRSHPGGESVSEGNIAIENIGFRPAPAVPTVDQAPGTGNSNPPLTSLIRFSAPPDAAAVWSRAMDACKRHCGGDLPGWRCLELIVDHFLQVWAPGLDPGFVTTGYPNAIFERDDWRCTVPGCRARATLTPHHIVKRSQGGGDEMTNMTTVCFRHHIEGIHRGLVSVRGQAPAQLVWELGRKVGQPPILAATGDWLLTSNTRCQPGAA